MASLAALRVLDELDDHDLQKRQDLVISSLGGIREILKLCLSKTEATDSQSASLLSVLNQEIPTNPTLTTNNTSLEEITINSDDDNDDDDEKLLYEDQKEIIAPSIKDTEFQKLTIIGFCNRYGSSGNWKVGKKESGVQKYVMRWREDEEAIQVRMSFLYSMTQYLSNVVGVNKRCISHAVILCKTSKSQIESLSDEFTLLCKTLSFRDDEWLWNYVFVFMEEIWSRFKKIEQYIYKRDLET